MKSVRNLSTILFYLVKIMSLLFLLVGSYAMLVLLCYWVGVQTAPIQVNGDHFTIFYPFTQIPFLLGDYSTSYLSLSISIMFLYGIFLWLLANVFLVFTKQKIFIPANMRRLKIFYLFNLFAPLLYIILLIILKEQLRDAFVIIFLHLMLSVFIFFMTTIFQQGLVLQDEQDQTL